MKPRLRTFSYRFAEQVLNGKLETKRELESALESSLSSIASISRPELNKAIDREFQRLGWDRQPLVFSQPGDPLARMDFLKDRVGVEVELGHPSFLGIDLLKFQVASYSGLDLIDVGVHVSTTKAFQNEMIRIGQKWTGSLSFEKVSTYLPHLKSAIQVPIYVVGIDA